MLRIIVFFAASLALKVPAPAHDRWANGDPLPAWVKQSCCGPADAHQLGPDQIADDGDDYVISIDGLTLHVPHDRALPSQDGAYWVFFNIHQTAPIVYCLFIPTGS